MSTKNAAEFRAGDRYCYDEAVKISVVIPSYQAGTLLQTTVDTLFQFFQKHEFQFEIVVVDDGSVPQVTITKHAQEVRLIRFEKNRGKGAALREGIVNTSGDIVLFTDADLPYGTEPILPAIDLIANHFAQVVIGNRRLAHSSYQLRLPQLRKLLSSLCSLFVRTLLVGGIPDTQCGFKAFRGEVAREIASLCKVNRFAIDIEMLYLTLKYQLDLKQIPVHLSSNATSTVRLFQDSIRATIDILLLKFRWMFGSYESNRLRAEARKMQEKLLQS